MFVLFLVGVTMVVPSPLLAAATNHTYITTLYRAAHMSFGCHPNAAACPTWDCATHYTSVGCDAVPERAEEYATALPYLSWHLCYDRGFQRYMFTTEVWNEACDCSATRFHRDHGTSYVCLNCNREEMTCVEADAR